MTTVLPPRRPAYLPAPVGLPRLLAGLDESTATLTLRRHAERWGPLRVPRTGALLAEVDASGLSGRGGAWFPVGRKWRSVAGHGRRRPVVVANGAEGEPASMKDAVLLSRAPHLVLDGAVAAALAVGAADVVVYVGRYHARVIRAAIAERRRAALDPVRITVIVAPGAFLAGQESAAVNVINGREAAAPSFVGIRSVRERGVNGRPTLVHNVESLAHVALIARYGADWFRRVGTQDATGSMLLTVHGRWDAPTVEEAPLGAPLRSVLDLPPRCYDSASADEYLGALIGGYGGGFVSMQTLRDLPLLESATRQAGSTLGSGVIALLPAHACPVAETARVVSYLADQGAGQCGPCVNGLAELRTVLHHVAFDRPHGTSVRRGPLRAGAAAAGHRPTPPHPGRHGRSHPGLAQPRDATVDQLAMLCDLIEGRGACRHPDGAVRLVRSACSVFADHFESHLSHGPCRRAVRSDVLPIPTPARGWRAS